MLFTTFLYNLNGSQFITVTNYTAKLFSIASKLSSNPMMISVYFYVSLITIISIVPTVFSYNNNAINMKQFIEKKHINEMALLHHDLTHASNNVMFKRNFKNYLKKLSVLGSIKGNVILWLITAVFDNFIKYEVTDNKTTDKMWEKAKDYLKIIKNKIHNKYVDKLYAAIQNKNKDDLINSVTSIRDYFYKTLETPFILANKFYKKIRDYNSN